MKCLVWIEDYDVVIGVVVELMCRLGVCVSVVVLIVVDGWFWGVVIVNWVGVEVFLFGSEDWMV